MIELYEVEGENYTDWHSYPELPEEEYAYYTPFLVVEMVTDGNGKTSVFSTICFYHYGEKRFYDSEGFDMYVRPEYAADYSAWWKPIEEPPGSNYAKTVTGAFASEGIKPWAKEDDDSMNDPDGDLTWYDAQYGPVAWGWSG